MPPASNDSPEESTEILLASLFSALSHDVRATINGINVWTHILERVSDPTAARAVEGIRRSISQQTELAQEISDFGREVFSAPGDQPADPAAALQALRDGPLAAGRLMLETSTSLPLVTVGERALRALFRFASCDLLASLSDQGKVVVSCDEPGATALRIHMHTRDVEGEPVEAHARRPLRQTLALLAARTHGVELRIAPGRLEFLLPLASA